MRRGGLAKSVMHVRVSPGDYRPLRVRGLLAGERESNMRESNTRGYL